MPVRICPTCERTWRQRAARFCGVCGAALTSPPADPGQRWHRRLTARAVRAGGASLVVVLLAFIATGELASPADPDAVSLLEGPDSANQVTGTEAEHIREQAEMERIRCVPHGCELWRIERAGVGADRGAVSVGDDVVLVIDLATSPSTTAEDDAVGPRLVGLDARNGAQRWDRSLPADEAAARLTDGPEQDALLVSPLSVTRIDATGATGWSVPARRGMAIHAATTYSSVIVVAERHQDEGGAEEVRGLDARSGEQVWSRTIRSIVAMDGDVLAVLDSSRHLLALDPETGEHLWRRSDTVDADVRHVRPWLVVQDQTSFRLLDTAYGLQQARFEGRITAGPMPIDDRWLAIVRDIRATDRNIRWWEHDVAQLQAVSFDDDGMIQGSAPLGMVRGWEQCCAVHRRPDGVVTIVDPNRVHDWDPDNGQLVRIARNPVAGDRLDAPTSAQIGSDVSRPRPDVEVARYRDLRRLDIRTDEGSVTIRGGKELSLESFDPILVSDGDRLVAVRVVPDS